MILSKKLNLTADVWQEIGTTGFVGQKNLTSIIEIVNADSLPVGHVIESQEIREVVGLQFSAPAEGSLYAKAKTGTAELTYYEV